MFIKLTRFCISCAQQHTLGLFQRNFRGRETVYEFVCPNTQETVYLHISDAGDVDETGDAKDAIVLCEVALSPRERVALTFD